MNYKMKSVWKIVLALVLLWAPMSAYADGGHGHEHGHWRYHNGVWVWGWGPGPYYYGPYGPAYPPATPPTVIIQQGAAQQPMQAPPQQPMQAPPQQTPPQQPAQQQFWHYCESTKSYYPYVPSCNEGWKLVSPMPPASGSPSQ